MQFLGTDWGGLSSKGSWDKTEGGNLEQEEQRPVLSPLEAISLLLVFCFMSPMILGEGMSIQGREMGQRPWSCTGCYLAFALLGFNVFPGPR